MVELMKVFNRFLLTNAGFSHLLALRDVFTVYKVNTVFEFGLGYASTLFFLEQTRGLVTSIEMDHQEWFDRLANECKAFDTFQPLLMLGPDKAIDYLISLDKQFDLIFVDGYPGSRWRAVNVAFTKAAIVVAHDMDFVELNNYHLIAPPKGWHALTYKESPNWTTVWSSDIEFMQRLILEKGRKRKRRPRKGLK